MGVGRGWAKAGKSGAGWILVHPGGGGESRNCFTLGYNWQINGASYLIGGVDKLTSCLVT